VATAAELLAVLRADSRQFSATMTRAVAQTRGLETSASRFSKTAKAGFLLVGAAVAKSVVDFVRFESTMTRLVTLGGAAQGEMRGLSKSVLAMAGDVATAPQELAEGLYFVYSAGIRGKAAMETLEYAAKGAAIGLGTVETVADATTSVLNAYGQENITAARATAVLREAVEQSKREADEIAGAIGRVLPIASEMGVEFEQVAGAIAAMTRTGNDANEAVTALRGVLVGILDPTDRAEKVLGQYGLSVKSLQEAIRGGNVVDVLLQLKDAFGENERAMGQVFPNVRALVGVLSLVGDNADAAQEAFRGVAQATVQELNESFEIFAATAEGKVRAAWASISAAMIEFGGAVAPVLKALADLVAVAAPLLKILLPLAAAWAVVRLAAAGVPIVLTAISTAAAGMGGAFTRSQVLMNLASQGMISYRSAVGGTVRSMINAVSATTAWTAALVAVGFALNAVRDYLAQTQDAADEYSQAALAGTTSLQEWQAAINEVAQGAPRSELYKAFIIATEDVTVAIDEQNREILAGTGLYKEWGGTAQSALGDVTNQNLRLHRSVAELILQLDVQDRTLKSGTEALVREKLAAGDLEGVVRILSRVLGLGKDKTNELASGTEALAGAHREAADAAKEQRQAEQSLAGGILGLLADLKGVRDAQAELNELREDGKAGTREYRDAQADLLGAQLQVNDGLRDYMQTLRTSGVTQGEAVRKVMALGRQVGLSAADVRRILGPLEAYRNRLRDINRLPNVVKTITTRFVTEGGGTNIVPEWKLGHEGGLINRHRGGAVERLHSGGFGRLAGDERAAILQVGEFVMRRAAVDRIGVPALKAMNAGRGDVALGDGRAPTRSSGATEIKVTVRPDRRRFGRDLGYDWLTRGW